jgi:TP901 family phage tail tape measure protein
MAGEIPINYLITTTDRGSRQAIAATDALRKSVDVLNKNMLTQTETASRLSKVMADLAGVETKAAASDERLAGAADAAAGGMDAQAAGAERAATATSASAGASNRAAVAADRAAVATERVGKSAGIAAGAVGLAGRAIKGLGLAALVTGGYAFKTGATFQYQMARVQAVSGATTKQFQAMGKEAQHLGQVTQFSAQDAANAMYQLATAGFSANQTMKIVPGTLALAAATSTDMGDAAMYESAAIHQFGLRAADATKVADAMTNTINHSAVEMYDLGLAMKYAGPVAKASGQDMNTLLASIGLLGNAGIRGSQAGTTLRTALVRLQAPTKQAKEALNQLHVTASDLYGPKGLKPFPQILDAIIKGSQGMAIHTRNAALAHIFGREALSGLVTMVERGTGSLEKQITALNHSQGAAHKTAQIMRSTVAGAFDNFRSSVETAAISLTQKFQPQLQGFFNNAAHGINDFAASLGGLDSQAKNTEKSAGHAAASASARARISARISGLPQAGAELSFQGPTGGARGAARARVLNRIAGPQPLPPPPPVPESLGTKVGKLVREVGSSVGDLASKYGPKIIAFGKQLLDAFKPAMPFLQNVLLPLIEGIGKGVLISIVGAFQIAIPVIKVIATVLGAVGRAAKPFKGIIEDVGIVLGVVFSPLILGKVGEFFGIMSRGAGKAGPLLKLIGRVISEVGGFITKLGDIAGKVFGILGRLIGGFVKNYIEQWKGAWGEVSGIVSKGWSFIRGLFGRFLTKILPNIVKDYVSLELNSWRGLWNLLRGIVSKGWNVIKGLFSSAVNAVWGFMKTLPGKLGGAAQNALSKVTGYFKSEPGKMSDALRNGIGGVTSAAKALGTAILNAIKNGIGDVGGWIKSKLSGALNSVTGFFGFRQGGRVAQQPVQGPGGAMHHSQRGGAGGHRHAAAMGGRVPGAPVAADSVPALLSPQEFVVTGSGESMLESMTFPGVLDYIGSVQAPHFRRGGRIPRFARGGRLASLELGAFEAGFAGASGQGGSGPILPDVLKAATFKPPKKAGSTASGPGSSSGNAHWQRALREMNRLDALHLPYVWGGGHSTPAPRNGPFDCSSAVSRVLQAAGYNNPTMVSGALASWGLPGKGRHSTIYANSGHVFMNMNGRGWGTSASNPGGGPGWLSYSSLPGYTIRHAPYMQQGGRVGRRRNRRVLPGSRMAHVDREIATIELSGRSAKVNREVRAALVKFNSNLHHLTLQHLKDTSKFIETQIAGLRRHGLTAAEKRTVARLHGALRLIFFEEGHRLGQQLAAATHRETLGATNLQILQLRQQLHGTDQTPAGLTAQSQFIHRNIIPSLQKELRVLRQQRQFELHHGATGRAQKTQEAIQQKIVDILTAQLDAQNDIKAATQAAAAALGTTSLSFGYNNQQWTLGQVGLGSGVGA